MITHISVAIGIALFVAFTCIMAVKIAAAPLVIVFIIVIGLMVWQFIVEWRT